MLRRYVRADWLEEEPDLAEHEARVLALLASSDVDAPRLVAVDPNGEQCDVPAVLMTRLPGRIRWTPRDVDGFLTGLVDAMLTIHAVDVPASVPIRPYTPYYQGEDARTACRHVVSRSLDARDRGARRARRRRASAGSSTATSTRATCSGTATR